MKSIYHEMHLCAIAPYHTKQQCLFNQNAVGDSLSSIPNIQHEKIVLVCVFGMVGVTIEICLSEKGALAKKSWEPQF